MSAPGPEGRPEFEFGIDQYSSRSLALQVDGNDLVSLTAIDEEAGTAWVTVYSSSHPDATVLFSGVVNIAERGAD